MEREHRGMISLFWESAFAAGDEVKLTGDAAQHARVRRVGVGDPARLLDGRGRVGIGTVAAVTKRDVTVLMNDVSTVDRPPVLEAIVPVADRDRMLWAAEKCAELQVTSWRPVLFGRSRSVAPRGEGDRFAEKVRLRMQSALEQSGGAWLPELNGEVESADAWKVLPHGRRLLFDARGGPIHDHVGSGPMAFAVGPEGGLEQSEFDAAMTGGWIPVSLGVGTLRFETAIVAGAGVIRATQLS